MWNLHVWLGLMLLLDCYIVGFGHSSLLLGWYKLQVSLGSGVTLGFFLRSLHFTPKRSIEIFTSLLFVSPEASIWASITGPSCVLGDLPNLYAIYFTTRYFLSALIWNFVCCLSYICSFICIRNIQVVFKKRIYTMIITELWVRCQFHLKAWSAGKISVYLLLD